MKLFQDCPRIVPCVSLHMVLVHILNKHNYSIHFEKTHVNLLICEIINYVILVKRWVGSSLVVGRRMGGGFICCYVGS